MASVVIKNWDNKTWLSSQNYINSFNNFLIKNTKINSNFKILDIGCGRGKILGSLKSRLKLKYKPLGIDIVNHKDRDKRINFKKANILNLSLRKSQKFDLILIKQTIHLIKLSKVKKLLKSLEKILNTKGKIIIFTLDTEKLFPETYHIWAETERKYKLKIKAYKPDANVKSAYILEHGEDAYYKSLELRKKCCYVRKIAPLKNALEDKNIWLSGVRASQSAFRADKELGEYDETMSVHKIYPILEVTDQELEALVKFYEVPVNILYSRNYPSIGCAPCTRAVKPGEDSRSGRWWWEQDEAQECGLHFKNGKLVRTKEA